MTEDEFYRRTTGRLRRINTFERHLGDLMNYWESNKKLFFFFGGGTAYTFASLLGLIIGTVQRERRSRMSTILKTSNLALYSLSISWLIRKF